jgi:hypothetical protein
VARAISGIISKIRGASWKSVDCRLILNKYRGFFVKWQEFSGFGIIFQWQKVVDRVGCPIHGTTVHSTVTVAGLTRAQSNGRSGLRWFAVRVAMRRG